LRQDIPGANFVGVAFVRPGDYVLVMDIFTWLIPLALAAVFITLCFGIYSLFRGGAFARSYSNRLMRLRVVLQFVAILILVAAMLWRGAQAHH
jgi:hypothetical protein